MSVIKNNSARNGKSMTNGLYEETVCVASIKRVIIIAVNKTKLLYKKLATPWWQQKKKGAKELITNCSIAKNIKKRTTGSIYYTCNFSNLQI